MTVDEMFALPVGTRLRHDHLGELEGEVIQLLPGSIRICWDDGNETQAQADDDDPSDLSDFLEVVIDPPRIVVPGS